MAAYELGLLKLMYDLATGKTYVDLGLDANKQIAETWSKQWARIQMFETNLEVISKAADERIKKTVEKLKNAGVITNWFPTVPTMGFTTLNKNNIQDQVGGSLPANRGYLTDYQLTAEWEQKQKNGPTEYDKDFQEWSDNYDLEARSRAISGHAKKLAKDLYAFDYINTLNHPETVPQNEYWKTQLKNLHNDVDSYSKVEDYLSVYGGYFPGLTSSIKKEVDYANDIEKSWGTGTPNFARAIAEGDIYQATKALSYGGGESVIEIATKTKEIIVDTAKSLEQELPDLPDPSNLLLVAEMVGAIVILLLISRK
jgi:hypothetical protein